jgi:hypothetical protein
LSAGTLWSAQKWDCVSVRYRELAGSRDNGVLV